MVGTAAQQKLAKAFFGPFFNWDDDEKLREWLQEQNPDELEQFLNWFDFSTRRDRYTLGWQELQKLRRPGSKITALLARGRKLSDRGEPVRAHGEFQDWVSAVANWLEAETNDPALVAKWSALPQSRLVRADGYDNSSEAWDHFNGVLGQRLAWLGEALSPRTTSEVLAPSEHPASRKVFIVHGHDDAARETIARFLGALDFEPIILHEQTNRGRTLIEKFEANSDVGFAVILLTPDDVGGKTDAATQKRARQNVILEWGYFIGRLGRSNVCALIKGDIELPSDIVGIVWEPLDSHGAWKKKLAGELHDAGLAVDWTKFARA